MDMATHLAHVVNGHLVLDEPVPLEEGAAVEVRFLTQDEQIDAEMTPEERAELDHELEEAAAEVDRGEVSNLDDFIARFTAK